MSFAEIAAELPRLTPLERAALARQLQQFKPFDDPELMNRLTRSVDEAERGDRLIAKEQLAERLRAAGRTV